MIKFKFAVGEHVAIHGGPFYGENGKIVEHLSSSDRPVYAVKIITGPYRDQRGSTVIAETDLRAE